MSKRPDHPDWHWIPSKRFWNGRLDNMPVDGIVQHYTAAGSGRSLAKWLATDDAKVSAHIVICRDGHIIQQVQFEDRAFHAGEKMSKGFWQGKPQPTNVNHISIGIENSNYGFLVKQGDSWYIPKRGKNGEYVSSGRKYPSSLPTPILAKGHDGVERWWEPYTDELVASNIEVVKVAVRKFGIKREGVEFHSDVSPHRKHDPGPLWPHEHVLTEVFGGSTEKPELATKVRDPAPDADELYELHDNRGDNEDGENPELHYDYDAQMSMVDRVHESPDEEMCLAEEPGE